MQAAHQMIRQTSSGTNWARFKAHWNGRFHELEDSEIQTFVNEAGWNDEWMAARITPRGKAKARAAAPVTSNASILLHAVPTPARMVPMPKAAVTRPVPHEATTNETATGHGHWGKWCSRPMAKVKSQGWVPMERTEMVLQAMRSLSSHEQDHWKRHVWFVIIRCRRWSKSSQPCNVGTLCTPTVCNDTCRCRGSPCMNAVHTAVINLLRERLSRWRNIKMKTYQR